LKAYRVCVTHQPAQPPDPKLWIDWCLTNPTVRHNPDRRPSDTREMEELWAQFCDRQTHFFSKQSATQTLRTFRRHGIECHLEAAELKWTPT